MKMVDMPTPRMQDQTRVVVSALRKAVRDESTVNYKAAAAAIARLRSMVAFDGRPDWRGASPEWKDLIQRLYRMAETPSDSSSAFQANLRYHVGNAVREIAPPEDLEALGLAKNSPLERARQSRSQPKDETTAEAMAMGCLRSIRALRKQGVTPEAAVVLRKIIHEAADALGDLA
jgi:hypothetical protein